MAIFQTSLSRRRGEFGRGAGCVLAVLLFLVALCAVAYIGGRLVAAPELGAPVAGPDHGATATIIAQRFGAVLATDLIAHEHTVVIISEHDLTVIARDRNPNPARFSAPEVRARDGLLLLSANTRLGPMDVVAVARVSVSISGASEGAAHLTTEITRLDVGRQTIPDFLRSAIDPRGSGSLSLDTIFNDSSQLKALRGSLECVFVAADGVHLGFHRPGSTVDPNSCVPSA